MKKKLKINYKVVWVSSIFLVLIVILIMVMDYKINYEYASDESSKMYFYKCDSDVCTMEVNDKKKKIYSSYDCWYGVCPVYKGVVYDGYVLLEENSSYTLFNYKTGTKVTSGYDEYKFISSDYIIVTKKNKDGVINKNGTIIVNSNYDKIGLSDNDSLKGYNTSDIIALKDGKYGIISYRTGKVIEKFEYGEENLNELLNILND